MGSKKSTKTKTTPFDSGAVKAGVASLGAANDLAQGTFAQYKPIQNAAIQSVADRMANPPGYAQDARAQLQKTINGDFVGQNPHTSHIADLIAQKTGAQYNSTFGAAGRARGGLASLLHGQGVGDALQGFYGNQYNQERGLQQQAIMAAPGFQQAENIDAQALFPMINNTAMGPLQAASMYGSGLDQTMGRYGKTKTTEKTPFGLQQAIGLAMMVGGAATGNPMMMQGGGSMASGGQAGGGGGGFMGVNGDLFKIAG